MQFKANDIVKVIHYESKFAGMLGEIRELMGDAAYVEFNDANGYTQDGRIINLSWLEWVYSPNGWKHPDKEVLNVEALDYLTQAYEMEDIEKSAYLHLHGLISGEGDNEF
ncbi:hypothetical protein SEA_CASSITA_118 [Microbacterium phage Cassita]|nr:hypothetical protein SEA_CASSITA_118 [Microbacterium phage Cassita]